MIVFIQFSLWFTAQFDWTARKPPSVAASWIWIVGVEAVLSVVFLELDRSESKFSLI